MRTCRSSDSQALQAFEGIFVKYMENWLRLSNVKIERRKRHNNIISQDIEKRIGEKKTKKGLLASSEGGGST